MSDTLALTSALSRGSLLDKIAGGSTAPQFDYLSALGRAQQVGQGAWALRQANANQLAGQAYQGAIDANGNFDPVKFRSNLAAAGPDAALAAQRGVESAQTVQGQQIDQTNTMRGMLARELQGLADPNLSPEQLHQGIIGAGSRLIAAGANPQTVMSYLLALPTDPDGRRAALEQLRRSTMSPEQLQQNVYGVPFKQTGPGSVTIGGTQSVTTGAVSAPPQAGVQQGVSPETAGQPVHWVDKDGVPHDTTWAEYSTARGLGYVTTPATVNGQPWSPPAGGGQTSPQVRPSPANPPRLNPQPARPQLTDTTGPAPGTVETANASAKQWSDDQAASGSFTDRVFPLAQAHQLLNDPQVSTGPGSQWFNTVKAFLQARAATFGADPATIGNVGKYEELNKYLTQYVNKMGSNSDAKLASALSGNPNTHITTLANRDVVAAMIGLERYRQAAILDFQAQGGEPRNWQSFLSKWQTSHDPRAFVADLLDQKKRDAMFDKMTGPERAAFAASLDVVDKNPALMNLPGMH